LNKVGLHHLTPGLTASIFQDWWKEAECQVQKNQKRGFNSLVILVHGGSGNIEIHVCLMEHPPTSAPSCNIFRRMSPCGAWQELKISEGCGLRPLVGLGFFLLLCFCFRFSLSFYFLVFSFCYCLGLYLTPCFGSILDLFLLSS
jgi:hypothetical protein